MPVGEKSFEEWYNTVPKNKRDTTDYDLRKAYYFLPESQLNDFVNIPDVHLDGDFKKPNHMTYSDDGYGWKNENNQWHFYASPRQQKEHRLDEYKTYWDNNEHNTGDVLHYGDSVYYSKKQGGKLTKYSELNDKDRWAAIRAGVRAGYNSIDDIERAYNEYAGDGEISHKFEDGSKITSYNDTGDEIEVGKTLDEIIINSPKGWKEQAMDNAENKIYDDPKKLFMIGTNDTNYNKWFDFYLKNNPDLIITGWNELDDEQRDWVLRNNPSAFNLLPRDVQNKYIKENMRRTEGTYKMGIRPGTFQRLVNNAGKNFLGESVGNAVTAASLISLPTAIRGGLVRRTINKVADVGYKALNSTNVGRNATNLMTKAVLPAVETKWGIEGVMNLPNDLRNVGQAAREGDYFGAAFEGVNTAFDASMIPVGMKNIPNISRGVKNEVGRVVENVGKRVNPLGEPIVPEGFSNIEPKVRTKLGDVEIDNPNLFYRQGNGPLADDLIESGIIRTKDTGEREVVRGINLTKPTLEKAMFNKGSLAFNPESISGKNLVTTSISDKMVNVQPRTWTGDAVYVNDWKTNPITKQEANAYIFEPGYGYRKINTDKPSSILWEEVNKY